VVWIILVLVVLAAAFGVLSAVLKTFLVIMLAFLLFAVTLVVIGWWLFRRTARRMSAEFDRSFNARSQPYGYDGGGSNPSPSGELPRHDDRY
jgi:purine-cytosine permease-like protein